MALATTASSPFRDTPTVVKELNACIVCVCVSVKLWCIVSQQSCAGADGRVCPTPWGGGKCGGVEKGCSENSEREKRRGGAR